MTYSERVEQAAQSRMQKLLELFNELSDDTTNTLDKVLKRATELVEMEIGIVSQIQANKYTIQGVHCAGEVQLLKGQEFDLGDTYCSITFTENKITDLNNIGGSRYNGHPCYVNSKLEAYIGVPLEVNGRRYGTLNFSSSDPRKVEFNQFDRDFVLYMGQWLSQHFSRLEYEKKLSNRNKKLRELLVERKKLTSILIHDLKAPLGNLDSLLELSRSMSDDSVIADMMKSTLQNAFELIKDLQEMNRLDQGKTNYHPAILNGIDCAEIIISQFLATAERKNINLVFLAQDELIPVETDNKLLNRILSNLMSNAIKYSDPKSTVEMKVFKDDNSIVFQVKDYGPGLSKEDKKKLFGRFQKLSARPTGNEHSSGLGLFIVKEITKLIKGRLSVESKLTEGSTFQLSLPLA